MLWTDNTALTDGLASLCVRSFAVLVITDLDYVHVELLVYTSHQF